MRAVLKADYHTHTSFCDGQDSAETMLRTAIGQGYTHYGFSSHGDTFFDADCRLETAAYFAACRALAGKYAPQIEVLVGIEEDSLAESSCNAEADYIVGSTHYLKLGDEYPAVDLDIETVDDCCRRYFGGDYYAYCAAYYRQEAVWGRERHCDFYGHFDLVSRFNDTHPRFDESDARYLGPALECMEYLASCGKPFEINVGAFLRGRKSVPYPALSLLRALKHFGGEIMINRDAHSAQMLCCGLESAVRLAMEAGFTHCNFLTRQGFVQQALDIML